MQPRKSILDRTFRYTPSVRTNIRKTFARVRFEQEQERRECEVEQQSAVVTAIRAMPKA